MAPEGAAGGRGTDCFGWRGPEAELPPTASRGRTAEPVRWGSRERTSRRGRKSESEGARWPEPLPPQCPGLTGQHQPPHQHHVPRVLAHVCRWLQWLQHGRGSGLLEQKPQSRQLPGGHDGEVDPSLRERRAVRTGPRGRPACRTGPTQTHTRLWDRGLRGLC